MGTFIVATILILVVGLAIFSMIKNKKKGKSMCGCNCSECPSNCSHKV